MSVREIEILLENSMELGECPLWHPGESALYWIDITGRAIHRFDPAYARHDSWATPSEPGCIAYCANGGLIVAMRSGLARFERDDGRFTPLAPAPYDSSRLRFNDGRCDASGRLWVGTLYDPRDRPEGSLYCFAHGQLRDMRKPVTVSNGVAFSTDNRTCYHADTTAHCITAYEFDLASGSLSHPRLFKQFSADRSRQYGGRPDGAAVDSENAYWCAMYEGGRLIRLAPSGEVLEEIRLPVRCPTMMAFGDADLRTLYVTSARHNRTAKELAAHPLSGCVFKLRVDVPGRYEAAYIP